MPLFSNKYLAVAVIIAITSFDYVVSLICIEGGYCLSDADCVPGSYCSVSVGYSQCLPNPPSDTCISTYGACGGTLTCCPGSTCTKFSAYYSQCTPITYTCTYPAGFLTKSVAPTKSPIKASHLFTSTPSLVPLKSPSVKPATQKPSYHSTLIPSVMPSTISPSVHPSLSKIPTPNPTMWPSKKTSTVPTAHPSTAAPSSRKPSFKPSKKVTFPPTAAPSTLPTIPFPDQKICRYSGYCYSTADCAPGNKCLIGNNFPYYTQCVQDLTQYQTVGCTADNDNCLTTQNCCNPGAFCFGLNPAYAQCVVPTSSNTYGQCKDPQGFPTMTPTASPTAPTPVPNEEPSVAPVTEAPVMERI